MLMDAGMGAGALGVLRIGCGYIVDNIFSKIVKIVKNIPKGVVIGIVT